MYIQRKSNTTNLNRKQMLEQEINNTENEIFKVSQAEALAMSDFSKTAMTIILEELIIN